MLWDSLCDAGGCVLITRPLHFHTSGILRHWAANRWLKMPFSACSKIISHAVDASVELWVEEKNKDLKTEDDVGPLKASLWRSSGPHFSRVLYGPASRLRKYWRDDAMSRLQAAVCIACIVIRVKSALAKVVYRDLQQYRDLQLHSEGTIIHIQCV